MKELKPEKLKQKILEEYRDAFRACRGDIGNLYYRGFTTAYRNTLQHMGYKWKELTDVEFVNKEIQGLREEKRDGKQDKEHHL